MRGFTSTAALIALALFCGLTAAGAGAAAVRRAIAPRTGSIPISHVVLIVQENRSFDNLFQGFKGADTASSGLLSNGKTEPLRALSIDISFDIKHLLQEFLAAYDGGKMDGFDKERVVGVAPLKYPQYTYVPQTETRLYRAIAKQYVLADAMFASHLDASFVAHQYLIAAQAQSAVDLPSGPWGCGSTVQTITQQRTLGPSESACFEEQTLADSADAKNISWKMYSPPLGDQADNWVGFLAINHIINGPDARKIVRPETRIFNDITAGRLPGLSWVIPAAANSDHPGSMGSGPDWVASVVNAVGESKYWNSTVIFIVWDDWGGFYDHVPPPYADYDGLGFRVPLIVVSPYANTRTVSHTQYEFGSILQFVEDTFGFPRLAPSDTRANSLIPDCFNFVQPPRTFKPFQTTLGPADFIRQSQRPPPPWPFPASDGD